MADLAAPPTGRVFISYRREETAYAAGWLFADLAVRFGRGQIFKDVDSIELGDDFVEAITTAVGSCDVLLALIGKQWLTINDEHGTARLDDPDDFVRLELEAALTRKVRVIPILVAGARMPRPDQLPPSLAKLARRQALELSPDHFEFDASRLHKVLDRALADAHAQPTIPEPDVAVGLQQAQLRAFYVEARAETRLGHFQTAIALLDDLLALDPGHQDATHLRAAASQQLQLADTYQRALDAEAAREWAAAANAYGEVLDIDATYRDAAVRREACQARQQLLDLQGELRGHAAAGQWQAVLDVNAELGRLDPTATDPDGLATQARHVIDDEKRAEEQARRDAEVQARRDAEEQARRDAEVQARRDAEVQARRDAEVQARRDAEEQARRDAEEQARRDAEEQARRDAEVQARRDAEEQARRDAEVQARRDAEVQARRDAEVQARRDAEVQARRDAEVQARRDAEEQARRDAEEQARRDAEEQARRDAEEQARRDAEEQARRDAEEQARRDAEEQARHDAEEQARHDAEEQARHDAEEQARHDAEEQARHDAEEQARHDAEEQARHDAEEQARHDAEEQARHDAEVQIQPETERKARVLTRRSVIILMASLSVGIVVVLVLYLTSSTNSLKSQIPQELSPSCTYRGNTASCPLDDNSVAKYDLFDTADKARTYVQQGRAPNGSCSSETQPTSGMPVICKYTFGTQRGAANFSYTPNLGGYYSATWNPDGKRVTGYIYSRHANLQDWESLWNNWVTLASMG